jgi:hypothetical protein
MKLIVRQKPTTATAAVFLLSLPLWAAIYRGAVPRRDSPLGLANEDRVDTGFHVLHS